MAQLQTKDAIRYLMTKITLSPFIATGNLLLDVIISRVFGIDFFVKIRVFLLFVHLFGF